MPDCSLREENTYQVALLHISVGIGAVLNIAVNIFFAHKWHSESPSEVRSTIMLRLMAIIITFFTIERVLQFIESWLWYHTASEFSDGWYYASNILFFAGGIGVLFVFLAFQLRNTFRSTKYDVPSSQIRVLYALISGCIVVIISFITLNLINRSRSNGIIQGMLIINAFINLIVSLAILGIVNVGFASRLRRMVVSSVVHSGSSPRIQDSSRRPSLSDWAQSHRRILSKAARSMVMAVWISVGYVLVLIAGLLFANAKCADWSMVIGQFVFGLALFVISSALSLSLSRCHQEYKFLCQGFQTSVQYLVAWQTARNVREMSNEEY